METNQKRQAWAGLLLSIALLVYFSLGLLIDDRSARRPIQLAALAVALIGCGLRIYFYVQGRRAARRGAGVACR